MNARCNHNLFSRKFWMIYLLLLIWQVCCGSYVLQSTFIQKQMVQISGKNREQRGAMNMACKLHVAIKPMESINICAVASQLVEPPAKRSISSAILSTLKMKFDFQSLLMNIKPVLGKLKVDLQQSISNLAATKNGLVFDTAATSYASYLATYLFTRFKVSRIALLIAFGFLFGPNGLSLFRNTHLLETFGELGIVLFVFEAGMEVSLKYIRSAWKSFFGLGMMQLLLYSAGSAAAGRWLGITDWATAVIVGAGFGFSSSSIAFDILKSRPAGELDKEYAKSAGGMLLFHDIAMIPAMILVEILATKGSSLSYSLLLAGSKVALSTIAFFVLGRSIITPLLSFAGISKSRETFTSVILSTVVSMSFISKGIGLPDTLGSFVAGLVLSGSKFRHQIEHDISMFRHVLLSLFFVSIGFHINLTALMANFPMILSITTVTALGKAALTTLIAAISGSPLRSALHTGLLTSQCCEFAFIAFGIAGRNKLISAELKDSLMTAAALTMSISPMLAAIGQWLSSDKHSDMRVELDKSAMDKKEQ